MPHMTETMDCDRGYAGDPCESCAEIARHEASFAKGAAAERAAIILWLRSPDQVGATHTATIARELEERRDIE